MIYYINNVLDMMMCVVKQLCDMLYVMIVFYYNHVSKICCICNTYIRVRHLPYVMR